MKRAALSAVDSSATLTIFNALIRQFDLDTRTGARGQLTEGEQRQPTPQQHVSLTFWGGGEDGEDQ